MKFGVILSLLLVLAACSKNAGTQGSMESKKLPYNSAIPYVFQDMKNKEDAAMVKKEAVSWSQLRSQAPALNELEEAMDNKLMAFAYAFALMTSEKSGGSKVSLDYFGKEHKTPLKDILAANGLELSDKVAVSYTDPKVGQVAKVGNEVLTLKTFMDANLSHSRLYRRIFNQRMRRLNGIVVRRMILEASKAEKMNMEEYVKNKILSAQKEVSEEDVRAFAKQRNISESDLNEKMIERLKAIVAQERRDEQIEKFVAKNLVKEPVQVGFQAPEINVKAPQLGENVPRWGDKDPSVLFIGHWSCDDCESPLKSFLKAKKEWGKNTSGAFIYSFPEMDREARMSAEAGLCVFKQNKSSFWSYMDQLVGTGASDNLEESINAAAKGSGVDFDQFRQCFLKREFQQAVDTHLVYAREMGVFKAPLLVVNGKVFEPPFDLTQLANVVTGQKSGQGMSFFAKIKNFFANLF